MLKAVGQDQVEIRAFGATVQVPFNTWLKETDAAIRIRDAFMRAGNRKPNGNGELIAAKWLAACGLTNQQKIDGYLQRRVLLDAPPDFPRLVHCSLCGRPLSDKISVALGQGPECRKK